MRNHELRGLHHKNNAGQPTEKLTCIFSDETITYLRGIDTMKSGV